MATYSESYEFAFPRQSNAEEIANAVTHGFGLVLGVVGAVSLLVISLTRGVSVEHFSAVALYGASLIAVYAASTFSHAFQEPRRKRFFRILDQAVIYFLIAGTYTPFITTYAPQERKWLLFGAVWALALAGFFSKTLLKHRIEAATVVTYIFLGWVPAVALIGAFPFVGFDWVAVGGVLYTVGTAFLTLDQRVPFFHATWHMFVLCASICHFGVVLYLTMHVGV